MNSKKIKNKTRLSKEKKKNSKKDSNYLSKTPKLIKKTLPLPPQPENYKQINEVLENGKLELVDYKGNITECNIFGTPKAKFIKDMTGKMTFKERLEKGLIKQYNYNSKSLYIPKTSNFEGSNMFPRPLSLPFVNQIENPDLLLKSIKKGGKIFEMKNKKLFSLKEPLKHLSIIPSFMCHKIGKNNPKDRNNIIKLIDNFISEKREQHKLDKDYLKKSLDIKALRKFKKKLNENMTNELYNGNKLSTSTQEDLMLKYNSIKNGIYINGIKNMKRANGECDKNINFESYKKIYRIKGVGNEKNIFKHHELLELYKLTENNLEENIDNRNSNENIYSDRKEKSNFIKTISLFNKTKSKVNKDKAKDIIKQKSELFTEDNYFKKTMTTGIGRNNENSLYNTFYKNNGQNKSYCKNNINLYFPNKLFFDNKNENNNNIYNIEKYCKTSNSFIKDKKLNLSKSKEIITNINNLSNTTNKNNFSYISEDKKDENNLIKKFKNGHNYKLIKQIKIKTENENNLLKGFISPSKELKFFKIYKLRKKDSTYKHYLNELELMKKVNIVAFEKEINLNKNDSLKKKIGKKKNIDP